MKLIVNSVKTLIAAFREIKASYLLHKYIVINLTFGKRSMIQNGLQFHWYKELEEQGDMTAHEYRRYCKYEFGMSIRAESDEFFAESMRDLVRKYTYEDRLKIMEYIDVTSTFDRKQMSRYLTEIKHHFSDKRLTNSDDI